MHPYTPWWLTHVLIGSWYLLTEEAALASYVFLHEELQVKLCCFANYAVVMEEVAFPWENRHMLVTLMLELCSTSQTR